MIEINLSRNLAARSRAGWFPALLILPALLAIKVTQAADLAATTHPSAIPWNEIGAKAGADYKGDGLAVTPTASGVRLRCIFQRLDGEATAEGLWLTSTATNTVSERFRVTAVELGRTTANDTFNFQYAESSVQLPDAGDVSVCGQTVRLSRPGLAEEYSVSMDGVRQDFIVEQAPPGATDSELVVKLAVTGAEVEATAHGARLVLDHSGRKIAYSRLRVTDATGKELPARIEASSGGGATSLSSSIVGGRDTAELAVVVNDADAAYPVRIDPTFSDANWISMGGLPGTDGTINAAVTDGSGHLYITGNFTIVDNVFANGIAEWNGTSWSALGSGTSGDVTALAVSGSTLYAGGGSTFTNAGGSAVNYIAQWNGTRWSALGSGVGGGFPTVYALAVSGSTLYAAGSFSTAGGIAANNIAKWNGSSWSPLGSGISSAASDGYGPVVEALAVSGSTLYVGGDFGTAGGVAANNLARWNGSSWSALGSGINGDGYGPNVSALAVSGGTLYAGGDFTNAGGIAANNIAQWNGSSWSALGSGISGAGSDGELYVFALAASGGTLYAGGDFSTAGSDTNANCIAQWNGTNWSALGSGLEGYPNVKALAVSGSALYVGGDFSTAGGGGALNIAQWNGSAWSSFGLGLNYPVTGMAVSGSTLYACGYFTTAGGSAANFIAQWNGSSWSPLGSGMSGPGSDGSLNVFALAVSGSTLYAGGDFTMAGGIAATNVAQWNGSAWSPVGLAIFGAGSDGYGPLVDSLAVSGNTLYVGGDFTITNAGGGQANCIARWDGTSWSALGSGMNLNVDALAVSGNTLYAGGGFTTAGGSAANYVAQWNGSSWSPLGSGISGGDQYGPYVLALAVSGGTLYVGGDFYTAGATAANNIAQWNGSSWSAIGTGMNSYVGALAVAGGMLYAGGEFTNAGDLAANSIAQWNGSIWWPLGSGVAFGNGERPFVYALAVTGNTLYAGGEFSIAGTNVSSGAAMANLPVPGIISTNAAFGFTKGVFGFDVSGPSGASVIIQASTNLQTWIPLQTNQLNGNGLFYFSDPQFPANVQRFYRALLSP